MSRKATEIAPPNSELESNIFSSRPWIGSFWKAILVIYLLTTTTSPYPNLNSFSQNSFPCTSSKVSQVGLGTLFTNWPINESLAISVRKWGLETMNIPFLQRLSMTLVLRKSLRKPNFTVRTMDIMMKSSSFPVKWFEYISILDHSQKIYIPWNESTLKHLSPHSNPSSFIKFSIKLRWPS